jgi:RND family efflux transporter MFP subunit
MLRRNKFSAPGAYAVNRIDRDGQNADTPKKRFAWRTAGLGAAAVIALGSALFAMKPKPAADATEAASANDRAHLVTTVTIEKRNFARTAPVSGEARPVKDIRVFAPVNGVRIAEVLAEIGDVVAADQPLARLDAGVINAQIKEAEAAVRQAASEQRRAAEEWGRVAPVEDDPAFSREEIARWRANETAARAQLASREASLEEMKAKVQGGFVRAPAPGLVIERDARVGEFADQKALFRIVGDNRLEVAAFVAEADMLGLMVGQSALFRASDGAAVSATLRVAPVAIDPETRTGLALFDLAPDAPVRAGMYLKGEVVLAESTELSAPFAAITYASGEPGVFRIEDGRTKLTPVTLGARDGDHVAILSGLKEGDVIAASGGAFIMDNDPVRTISAEESAASREAEKSRG